MSKRYSGKSFKDSSIKKKPKLSLKQRKQKKKSKKDLINHKFCQLFKPVMNIFQFYYQFKNV